jgi:hypothetical protein
VVPDGAPIVDHLQPGLSDEQMDELTAPLGLSLPVEARRWWGWHDGVDPASARIQADRMVGPLWRYQPLSEVEFPRFRGHLT